MPLTMRPTGRASPIGKDRQDFTVYCGDWPMGRIYEERGGPEHMRWFWTPYGVVDHALTLEEAKTQLEATWRQWLAWAKLREDT